jgi:hypothetical protein
MTTTQSSVTASTRAPQTVTLNYGPDGFIPSPHTLKVLKNDTFTFQLGQGPKNGTLRITFKDPQFFSKPGFESGDDMIQVIDAVRATTYTCELLVDGEVRPNPDVNGGGIEPDTGRASG